jgi:hypothetical protein
LTFADHLLREAAEALLELATGTTRRSTHRASAARRCFRASRRATPLPCHQDVEELERALDAPWENGSSFFIPYSVG